MKIQKKGDKNQAILLNTCSSFCTFLTMKMVEQTNRSYNFYLTVGPACMHKQFLPIRGNMYTYLKANGRFQSFFFKQQEFFLKF